MITVQNLGRKSLGKRGRVSFSYDLRRKSENAARIADVIRKGKFRAREESTPEKQQKKIKGGGALWEENERE